MSVKLEKNPLNSFSCWYWNICRCYSPTCLFSITSGHSSYLLYFRYHAFLCVHKGPTTSPNSAPAKMPFLLPEKLFPRLFIMEKAMATHSSTLAWKIPWTEEPGGLQSMGSLRVRHDWAISLSLLTFMHWRRKWLPTPVFLAWRIPGTGSLMGCCLWGRTESNMTEAT